MIITSTPLRVSFLGGGTDYPDHFSKHGGATLGTSIDRSTFITVTPLTRFFDHKIRISYSKTELCSSIDEIQHPSVRECLRFLAIQEGIEISVVADLPARTGLGSSSSFTVGLLLALHAFKGELVSKEQLAAEAVHVEREMIQERVGLQDQYMCAIGGLTHLQFRGRDQVNVNAVPLEGARMEALESRLMLFYTGLQRTAHEVLATQIQRTRNGELGPYLMRLESLVREGLHILCSEEDLRQFGDLLHQGWMLKRQLSDAISNSLVDDAYERARAAGAIGGKLLGAGGGGFLLVYAEPEQRAQVISALADLQEVPFHFEDQGSRLIFYRPRH